MRYLVAILLAALLASCTCAYHTRKAMAKCGPLKQSDSVRIEEKVRIEYRDTTKYITVEGPKITVKSPCDSLGNLRVFDKEEKKNGVVTHLHSDGKSITADCKTDSLEAVIRGLKTEIRERSAEHIKTVEKPVRIKTWWDTLYQWWFWISVSVAAGYIAIKILVKKNKLFS